jgi:MFS family permease
MTYPRLPALCGPCDWRGHRKFPGLSIVVLFVVGFAATSQMAATNTTVQNRSPEQLRARLMAVYATMFTAWSVAIPERQRLRRVRSVAKRPQSHPVGFKSPHARHWP